MGCEMMWVGGRKEDKVIMRTEKEGRKKGRNEKREKDN